MIYQVYGKDNCKYCFKAVSRLSEEELPFEEFKLGKDFTREDLLQRFPQAETYPQIQIVTSDGVTYVGGYEELVKHLEHIV